MPLAVSSYELSLFIHVTAVVVGFGATFAESVMFPVALKMGTRYLPYVHRIQLTLNQFFAVPALLIVTATGVYQMAEGNWDYGDLWVSGTLTIVVVLAILNLAYFIPSDRKALPMIERELSAAKSDDFEPSDDYMGAVRLQAVFGPITGILLIIAIYLMTTKPGL